ncbi:MAG: hypothetical protein K2N48_04300 [Muribaculaceae bacterium]|nr:hypothetical protein [Muribaculaceae bacterium]
MKKFLLFAAAAMVVVSASAETKNVLAEMYPGPQNLIGWGTDGLLEAANVDGRDCLKVTNTAATDFWGVQIAYDTEFVAGTTYYFTFDVKGDAGTITSGFQQTNGYIGCGNFDNFSITSDWNTVTIKGTAETSENGDPNRWVANVGEYVGSFYISNLSLYTVEEGGETPVEPEREVIASMYPGDAQFIAWGVDGLLTQDFEIDGRKAAKFDQTAEGKNPWEVQFAYDYDYVPGTTYYISFEVKGDAAAAIGSGFQCTDGWVGCGDCSSFAITPDWTKVVISGTPNATEDGKLPNRWVASIGTYVGTFYISNVEIYVEKDAAVETIAPAKAVVKGVYNLQGVKVANSLDEVAAHGIYIYNGKKVVR